MSEIIETRIVPPLRTDRPSFCPNPYVSMMSQDFRGWTFSEGEAARRRGLWRSQVFGVSEATPLDLEIGIGNGFFFAHRAASFPDRRLLGIELKFKPLVQSVRRALRAGATNMRALRYDAGLIKEIFSPGELNDVFIFFPDPWPRRRSFKHRLIQTEFLADLFEIQKSGSLLEIKTDNRDYFDWIVKRTEVSCYAVERKSYDLHNSEWASENFQTHFEKLWTKQGLPTHYLRLRRN